MTCIVGINRERIIYIGGDSAGANDTSVDLRADQKVFLLKKRFIIGFTTSFRMGQLLRFSLKVPCQRNGQDDYEFMCTTFINAVRKCFKEGNFGEDREGGEFLVGYRGNIYKVESDFQVGRKLDSYDSVGAGQDFALGSLYTTEESGLPPEKRIIFALRAAVKFSRDVREPFYIYKLHGTKK